nr:MAG TPA: hypothetical protein [Caudoviricetes sp.]
MLFLSLLYPFPSGLSRGRPDFLRISGLTVFDKICYNTTLGHTENGGRFDFQLDIRLLYRGDSPRGGEMSP